MVDTNNEEQEFYDKGDEMTEDAEIHAILHPPRSLWQKILLNLTFVGGVALGGYMVYDSADSFAETTRLGQSIAEERNRRASLEEQLDHIRDRASIVAEDGTLISRLPATQGDIEMLMDYCDRSRTIYQGQSSYQRILANTVELDLHVQGRNGMHGAGRGSGVLITQNGYIVTAHHVIEDMISGVVRLRDGGEHQIEHPAIISSPEHDLAIIKIDLEGLARPIAYNRDFNATFIGEHVFVFGYFDGIPFNQMGRIFEVNRQATYNSLDHLFSGGTDVYVVENTSTMTTYVRRGFSGGPVVRMRDGALIGITTYARFEGVNQVGGPSGFVPLVHVRELLERYLAGQASQSPE